MFHLSDQQCTCGKHAVYGWKKSGFLVALMCTFMYSSLFLPYIIAISTNAMPAFLPFISQAGGMPPRTWTFTFTLILASVFILSLVWLSHESISHRNIKNLKIIQYANKLGTVFMLATWLGFVMTANFPVGYTTVPNKYEWILTVFLEHVTSATILIGGMSFHLYCLTVIRITLPDTTVAYKLVSILASLGLIILFFISLEQILELLFTDMDQDLLSIEVLKNTTYELPLVFSTRYNIFSVCEWAACLIGISHIFTFYGDMNNVSFKISIRPKSCPKKETESSPNLVLLSSL